MRVLVPFLFVLSLLGVPGCATTASAKEAEARAAEIEALNALNRELVEAHREMYGDAQ